MNDTKQTTLTIVAEVLGVGVEVDVLPHLFADGLDHDDELPGVTGDALGASIEVAFAAILVGLS